MIFQIICAVCTGCSGGRRSALCTGWSGGRRSAVFTGLSDGRRSDFCIEWSDRRCYAVCTGCSDGRRSALCTGWSDGRRSAVCTGWSDGRGSDFCIEWSDRRCYAVSTGWSDGRRSAVCTGWSDGRRCHSSQTFYAICNPDQHFFFPFIQQHKFQNCHVRLILTLNRRPRCSARSWYVSRCYKFKPPPPSILDSIWNSNPGVSQGLTIVLVPLLVMSGNRVKM